MKKTWISFWVAVIGGLNIFNLICHKKKNWVPLSQVVRFLFKTKTRGGRIALTLTWGTLTAILLPHWYKQVEEAIEEYLEEEEVI